MADIDPQEEQAPLVPGKVPHPGLGPPESKGLAEEWRGWIGNPRNQAAMMQFGVALSQPISAGQNRMGHIGQAFGQAGEASDRVLAQQMKEEELASKQDLRTAQADLAGARAGAAETRAGAAAQRADWGLERLQLAREVMELRRSQGDANARIRAQEAYRKLQTSANLAGDPPPPPFDEWYASVTGGAPSAAPTGMSTADQQAREWAIANPRDPRAAAIKRRLGIP